MQFTCCTKCSFIVNYCNKVSSRIVLTSKGFSVFFWITLSHEVSRHFPTHTHPYQHMRTLRRFYISAVHWRIYPFIGGESDVPWKERNKSNPGSSVADWVHTAIFQNIRENRVPCNANQIQGEVPTQISDLHQQQQKGNR